MKLRMLTVLAACLIGACGMDPTPHGGGSPEKKEIQKTAVQ
jgi:hypothetical protein